MASFRRQGLVKQDSEISISSGGKRHKARSQSGEAVAMIKQDSFRLVKPDSKEGRPRPGLVKQESIRMREMVEAHDPDLKTVRLHMLEKQLSKRSLGREGSSSSLRGGRPGMVKQDSEISISSSGRRSKPRSQSGEAAMGIKQNSFRLHKQDSIRMKISPEEHDYDLMKMRTHHLEQQLQVPLHLVLF